MQLAVVYSQYFLKELGDPGLQVGYILLLN